jgi:ubiquinone biosynthesis O-methyltransferase
MRTAHSMVYGSSYDRGLEHLLKLWPKIKAEVPDSTLHVFYGWDLFDKVYSDNPERQGWKKKMNDMMTQPGITQLGRISHEAVRKEMENAAIWAYPTHFGEISCITAMKAQAWGAIPVVIDYAALSETVQWGIKVKGDIYDPDVKELYLKALVSLLKDEKQQESIRPKMMEWAKKFSWESVAKQWSEEFKSDMSLDKQVEALLEDNQAIKAWELVKDTDWPKKDRLWLRVQHAYDPVRYRKYYSEELEENPMSEQAAFEVQKTYPRFDWMIKKIEKIKPKTLVDLGCADGYLCLTLANKGIKCTGVNLYKPSVDLANERAKKFKVPANFVCEDVMDHKGKYDVVVMAEIIEHVPDPASLIEKARQMLNKGGTLFITTPSPEHIGITQHKAEDHASWDDGQPSGHLRIFNEAELKDLVSEFELVEFKLDDQKCYLVEVKLYA